SRGAALDQPHDLLPSAVEATHDGALGNPQSPRRLLVREAGDVDRDEHVAIVGRKRGDRRIDLAGLYRGGRLGRAWVGDDVELLRQRRRPKPAALRALLTQE